MGVNGLVGTPFGLSGTYIEPKGGILGQKGAFWGPWLQKRPIIRSKCVVTMSPTQLDQPATVGTKSGTPGLAKDVRGPQKGSFGPKRGLLGAPGVPLRSVKRQEHMVYMQSIQLDQPVAVGTKSGHLRPPEDLRGPQKGLLGPN